VRPAIEMAEIKSLFLAENYPADHNLIPLKKNEACFVETRWCPHQDSNLELRIRNPTRLLTKHSVMISDSLQWVKMIVDWVWIDGNLYFGKSL